MAAKRRIFHKLLIVGAGLCVLLAGVLVMGNADSGANAQTAAGLQAQINQIENEIKENEAVLDDLGHQAATLEEKIAEYRAEIATTQSRIDATNLKIKKLNVEIKEAEAELERQEGILADSIRELYKRGDITTIEMLASAEDYSDFINQQEYLERMKSAVQESAAKVDELKNKLESDRQQQQGLKQDLEGQRRVLSSQQADQQQLLDQTKGQEAEYQELLEGLKEKRQKAEAALSAALSSGSFRTAPVGPVSAGDVIGAVGNTGLSSGSHLHLEVRLGGSITNPAPYIKHQPVNPVHVTQGFGNISPLYVGGSHPGIDYGPGNGQIYAIDSGHLFRGCSDQILGTSNNAYGYVAIVDHGGGRISVYAHMSGGPAACNYNTFY